MYKEAAPLGNLKDSNARMKVYEHLTLVHNSEYYLKEHQDIIDALRGKTNKRPEKLMESHIERTRKDLLDYYRMIGS